MGEVAGPRRRPRWVSRSSWPLLPAKPVLDVPLALAIAGLGILIIIAPSSVPGITPLM